MAEPQWLEWARRLQAIAQNGLAYARDPFDQERYRQVRTIAAEMFSAGTNQPIEAVQQLFAAGAGYLTPKVDVRGAIFRGDSVLLVKERSDDRWTLPGGWADVDTTPAEAVERELQEEAGLEAVAVRLLAVYDKTRHEHPPSPERVYKLVFDCDVRGGTLRAGTETAGAAFFTLGALPALSLERVTEAQLGRLFELHSDKRLGTDFD